MKTVKLFSIVSVALLLAGCSVTTINQTEEITNEDSTGEVVASSGDTADISGTQIEMPTVISADISGQVIVDTMGNEVQRSWATGETIAEKGIDTPATIVQDNTLKEKIRALIEKRKIESKPATELTEEDIQLMEDILKEIVEETSQQQ